MGSSCLSLGMGALHPWGKRGSSPPLGGLRDYMQLTTPRLVPMAVRMVMSVWITSFQMFRFPISSITIYHLAIVRKMTKMKVPVLLRILWRFNNCIIGGGKDNSFFFDLWLLAIAILPLPSKKDWQIWQLTILGLVEKIRYVLLCNIFFFVICQIYSIFAENKHLNKKWTHKDFL